ncbi:MAG: YihA family ribosome biogenesis GTP-binding protein [Flavobacteriales bacterium CG_4_9_14_3_um_filter_40_17]|nr:MAG: YihA family ribosome biogenesis GTP-binding protein [Flavobacteriales bacterium CG_4_9_14_3_um_filter_40_17]
MKISSAEFLVSNSEVAKCPKDRLPEYAFIGRSNVGKSSLINLLTGRKDLAKTSGKPGKTQLINHFLINKNWFLVDLPGYGYAKVSKKSKSVFQEYITDYFLQREQLVAAFVLLDIRLEPQKIDLEFLEWLGVNEIPFFMVFTKADKVGTQRAILNVEAYKKVLLESMWEELPETFITSAVNNYGRDEILKKIQEINAGLPK